MKRNIFRIVYITLLIAGLALLGLGDGVSASGREVYVLAVEGNIVPVVADYISNGISDAQARGCEAVVIEMNTPGGLLDTTEKIVGTIMNADIPVIVYITPQGAWAASAGTFITVSAHLSGMAPATSIGAAHPVSGSGEAMPEDVLKKTTEYSAAWIQSIAEKRGRDPALVDAAVRESKSFTVQQAKEAKLIDFTADNLDDLLRQMNGRTVTLASGRQVTLNTEGAQIFRKEMSGIEKFLHMISNPNIAYILLSLASIGLITELSNPGMIFPGVLGGIFLFMAFYSLGVLNAYWAGVLLILLAFGLFAAEIFVASYGILTTGGVISLILGSLILFSESDASMQVDKSLIAVTVIFIVFFVAFLVWATVRGQTRKVATGKEGMVGLTATVKSALNPRGKVMVEGEMWSAEIDEGSAQAGDEVVVKKVDNLKLIVSRKK